MATYLVFSNEEDCNAREQELSDALGYPNVVSKTEKYAEPISNLNSGDNRCILPICEIWSPKLESMVDVEDFLTPDEISSLKDRQWVESEGWFSKPL